MIYPSTVLQSAAISYLPKVKRSSCVLYIFISSGVIILMLCLPFVYTDISVKTNGITRPVTERTEVRSLLSGIIDSIFFQEGDQVQKDAILLQIKDLNTKGKKTLNQFEISQRQQFIHDLSLLTTTYGFSEQIAESLHTALYREQARRFLHQQQDHDASLTKANREIEINTSLAKDKVISPKEFFDSQINQQKLEAGFKAFVQEQLSNWQQDLARYRLELSQYQQQMHQVNTDAVYYQIKAPVSGSIQNINTKYTGGLLQANETVCSISPGGSLVGECYVQTKDVGLLQHGQSARYQVEAFDYNYFGVLTGRIISIDNDFTVMNNTPVIKVRCSFDSTQLHLKNGFSGQLKKGLNFQASFMVARRSLWQLLFDKLDDWLNPNALTKTVTVIEARH